MTNSTFHNNTSRSLESRYHGNHSTSLELKAEYSKTKNEYFFAIIRGSKINQLCTNNRRLLRIAISGVAVKYQGQLSIRMYPQCSECHGYISFRPCCCVLNVIDTLLDLNENLYDYGITVLVRINLFILNLTLTIKL